jgi:uncharacterized protein (TIGR02246 family)
VSRRALQFAREEEIMRNWTHRVATLAIIAMLPATGAAIAADQTSQPAPGATQPGSPPPELQKLVDTYAAAWAKGDASAIAALYASNAIYIDSGTVVMRGRSEIEAAFKKRFAGELKGTKLTISPGQNQQLTPDVRIDEGAWQISGPMPPAEAATTQPRATGAAANAGRYLNTYMRDQGKWVIASTASIPEPPKVP